ncbi:MAG: NAD(+)/NADH kinase, partial [Bacteroidales bacterium]|nr:NAD(+)/NADH kinase [Bacteroidales bacterium]
GINTGRLGFLATVSPNDISKLINYIVEGNYDIEERTLLKLDTKGLFDDFFYALNDITIQKVGSGLITIHTYLDDEYLNSYWADGLIIATPTGSTAYSLSVGGPIMVPNSGDLIISPIAPHTLSVRPIVVPDFVKITLKVESRDLEYILSLDHQSKRLSNSIDINISKGEYKIKLLKLPNTSYYQTLRNKLMWGIDKRN